MRLKLPWFFVAVLKTCTASAKSDTWTTFLTVPIVDTASSLFVNMPSTCRDA